MRVRSLRTTLTTLVLLLAAAPLACLDLPQPDLEGPRVLACSLAPPRSVEVPVLPTVEIALSEPIDPSSVHAGSVGLFAWEGVGDCSLTPLCDEGTCERGRCMVPTVRASDRSALDRGELDAGLGVPLEFELVEGPAGPRSLLRVRPQRALAPHARHTLIVGAALRDRGGAALIDAWGRVAGFERDFVTAARGSAGPEPELVTPLAGELAVPTNLAAIELRLTPPIPWPQLDARLWLEDDAGQGTWLIDAELCPGWLPGSCVRVRPSQPLAPERRHRVAGGSLVDRLGRPAIASGPLGELGELATWFETGSGPDLDPPQPDTLAELRDRCVVVWVASDERLAATLHVDGLARTHELAPGIAAIGVAAGEHPPGDAIAWTLELSDRAANSASVSGELIAGPSFDPSLPRLAFSEVLANPLGPEPDAEFIELVALAGPLDTSGLLVSDRSPDELHASWLRGDEPPGDPLPSATLEAGELALLVGASWAPALGGDPAPPADATALVLDASLGAGGLANAGEPLTLWRPSEQGPQIVARYGNWIDTSAKAHGGRSVVGAADPCDLPDRWRSHPLASSSPGRLP